MPRSDAASSGVKYRNATEFEDTRFRVKRGMTINKRFLEKLNEYHNSFSNIILSSPSWNPFFR